MIVHTAPTESPQSAQAKLKSLSVPLRAGVAVQMSVYNAMPYLVDAVESILRQTYSDFDFIIVDDGSTDDSLAYLHSVGDPRMQIYRQPNRGTAAAGNHGLLHCQREFVARMDADDWSDPDRLRLQAAALTDHPDVAAVGSCFAYFGDRSAGKRVPMPTDHETIDKALMIGDHGLVHGACMMRTEHVHRLGGYWQHPFFEDWDLFLRLGEVGRLMNLPENLYLYRAHDTSLSSSRLGEMRMHYDYAIELAERRRTGQRLLTLDEFSQSRDHRGAFQRFSESLDNIALKHYRMAMGEVYSNAPLRGRLRLGLSAFCSPARTWQRLLRGVAFSAR